MLSIEGFTVVVEVDRKGKTQNQTDAGGQRSEKEVRRSLTWQVAAASPTNWEA